MKRVSQPPYFKVAHQPRPPTLKNIPPPLHIKEKRMPAVSLRGVTRLLILIFGAQDGKPTV